MAGPKLQIAISVLADGRVVFGDLPPELAEVAAILSGEGPLLPGMAAEIQAPPTAEGVADSPDPDPLV